MSTDHNGGNIQNAVLLEEHDGANNAKRVNVVAGGVGQATVTLVNSNNYIGLTTATLGLGTRFIGLATVVQASSARTITGNLTLSDSRTYIGLTTTTLGTGLANIGFATVAVSTPTLYAVVNTGGANTGNITLNPSPNHIGSVSIFGSVTANTGMTTLFPGPNFIGLTTSVIGNALVTVTLGTRINSTDDSISVGQWYPTLQSLASGALGPLAVDSNGRQLLGDPKGYIGLVTVTQASAARTITGNLTLSDAKTYIGLTTTTLGVGDRFIGLVTSSSRNAGTTKTLAPLTVTLSTTSLATIVVPTNANTIYVTNMLLSANATVRVSIRSGATYLTGNASIGITLFPGGGFNNPGSPDSPAFIGLPSGALIIEKNDITTSVGGSVIYFQE